MSRSVEEKQRPNRCDGCSNTFQLWFLLHGIGRQSTLKDCAVWNKIMPKLKSRKAAAKRFRRSGSGKIMRRKAFKNHLLEHKKTARKSRLSKINVLSEADKENVELMLPYL